MNIIGQFKVLGYVLRGICPRGYVSRVYMPGDGGGGGYILSIPKTLADYKSTGAVKGIHPVKLGK